MGRPSLASQGAAERRKRDQAITSAQGGTTRSSKTHKQNRKSGDTMTAAHQADQSEAAFKRATKAKSASLKKKRSEMRAASDKPTKMSQAARLRKSRGIESQVGAATGGQTTKRKAKEPQLRKLVKELKGRR